MAVATNARRGRDALQAGVVQELLAAKLLTSALDDLNMSPIVQIGQK